MLRRLGRDAAVACVLMAAGAFVFFGAWGALGVIGGGLLIGISFYALGGATEALATLISGGVSATDKRRIAGAVVVKLVFRYALLGFLAYVMIARLRLHPVGLLAGASSVAAATVVEAARFLLNGSKRSSRSSSSDRRYR